MLTLKTLVCRVCVAHVMSCKEAHSQGKHDSVPSSMYSMPLRHKTLEVKIFSNLKYRCCRSICFIVRARSETLRRKLEAVVPTTESVYNGTVTDKLNKDPGWRASSVLDMLAAHTLGRHRSEHAALQKPVAEKLSCCTGACSLNAEVLSKH
eukprot:2113546-Amphidinium_carterae.2